MEKAGGNNNASTSEDLTTYTDWFPSSALELMFDMEGDRIRDLALDPKMVASERGVVYSERRTSVDNSNFGILYEQLQAAAFIAHPYHWPVVGWPSDIEAWTQQDLQDYFAVGYAPNNCTMVVVGDVTIARVMELAKKYIEPIPASRSSSAGSHEGARATGRAPHHGEKARAVAAADGGLSCAGSKNPDAVVVDLMSTMLSTGQSSRLYKRMVDEEPLAISVNGRAGRFHRSDADDLHHSASQRSRHGAHRKGSVEELEKLQTTEVPARELQKAKNQMLTLHYQPLEDHRRTGRAAGPL